MALVIGTSMAIFNPKHDIISQFFPITGKDQTMEEYYGDPLNSIFLCFFYYLSLNNGHIFAKALVTSNGHNFCQVCLAHQLSSYHFTGQNRLYQKIGSEVALIFKSPWPLERCVEKCKIRKHYFMAANDEFQIVLL